MKAAEERRAEERRAAKEMGAIASVAPKENSVLKTTPEPESKRFSNPGMTPGSAASGISSHVSTPRTLAAAYGRYVHIGVGGP